MANEYKIQDWIDQYIKDELEGEALDIFKKKLREDEEFAQKVELQKAIVAEIAAQRKAELKDFIQENAKVEYIQNIWGTRWMYASAAIIVVAIGLYFAIQRIDQNRIPDLVHTEETTGAEDIAENDQHEAVEDAHDAVDTATNEGAGIEDLANGENPIAVNDNAPPDADTEDEPVTLTELSQEEREIASDDNEVVEKDSILATKVYPIVVLAKVNTPGVALESDDLKNKDNIEEVVVSKKASSRKERRANKERADEVATDADADSLGQEITGREVKANQSVQYSKTTSGSVKVDFWKSVVGFEGYKFNGSMLQLYGVAPEASIHFKKFEQTLYINIAGTYFALQANNQFNKYKQVNDATLLEILAK